MSASLRVRKAGPLVSIQDLGRVGFIAHGLSKGGAVDPLALIEGAALLNQSAGFAALEMAGFGGVFEATTDMRIALTGAQMTATIDGTAIEWNASHSLQTGQTLSIGIVQNGTYGYLHVGGGIEIPQTLGSRSAHLTAGIGDPIKVGDVLPVGHDPAPEYTSQILSVDDRFSGGLVRVLPSVHTAYFSSDVCDRFSATEFTRTPRSNRQGVELAFEGDGFASGNALSILSEPMLAGDIQMTGEGYPFVLLQECQTTGGYPRIGMVLPDDLSIVSQAPVGVPLRFKFITQDEGIALHQPVAKLYASLRSQVRPRIRDPHDINDLLSYQLISGAITGNDEPYGGQND